MATDASDRSRSNQRSTARQNNEGGVFSGATGAMIGAAAAGVAVGLMANLGRKTAVQAPPFLPGEMQDRRR